MDGFVESDPESSEEAAAQETADHGHEEVGDVERGPESGGENGQANEEERQPAKNGRDNVEGGNASWGRSTSEEPASEFSDGLPQGEANEHRPAAPMQRPRNSVQSWYRWKKRCKNAIKMGLDKHEGLALFCTLSLHGRWQTRGSQSLIADPAFPIIEQQLQRLAAAKHELSAARVGIFQNATQRRRGEREAAAGTAAEPETQRNAEN